ncbi:MAG: ATP-binding protein [Clostridiales Family XIII bacterium]|jgi:hypothetical protein|nr:ATP-binding protein [Clostridiales Family XIII bacterium]
MIVNNPFTPVFGSEPSILAGRNRLISDVVSGLENGPGDPHRVTIFTGPRGSGKTVLLAKIASEAEQLGWLGIHATATRGMLDSLLEQTREKAAEFVEDSAKSHITGVQVGGFGVTRQIAPSSKRSWRSQISEYLDKLNALHIGLLITVDEVTSREDEMITLITTFQHFIREKRNVALIMAGLPNNVIQMFQHDSISFLRRAFLRPLSSVDIPEVRIAIRKTVEIGGKTIAPDALELAANETNGFPFMIQLIGYHMFNQATQKKISAQDVRDGVEIARADMKHMIIDATLRDLSELDLKFLIAMAQDEGDSRMSDIAKRMDTSPANAGYYRRRLIELGIITPVGRGRVSINIPLLKDWLSKHTTL